MLPQAYEYGSNTSLFESLFDGGGTSAANILEMAEYIKEQALARSDSTMCRHMLGDMMYYLMDTPGEEIKLALRTFITMYVEGDSALWSDPSDIRRIVRPAEVCKDLLDRVPVGSRIPRLKVRGVLLKDDGPVDLSDVRNRRLRSLYRQLNQHLNRWQRHLLLQYRPLRQQYLWQQQLRQQPRPRQLCLPSLRLYRQSL